MNTTAAGRLGIMGTHLLPRTVEAAALSPRTQFVMKTQSRQPGDTAAAVQTQIWHAAETALIVCDMWDLHHSLNATRRGGELCPRMQRVLATARSKGAQIIHAPSGCMEFYAGTPARDRAIAAPLAPNSPGGLRDGVQRIDTEPGEGDDAAALGCVEGGYPIDQRDGGEVCQSRGPTHSPFPIPHVSWYYSTVVHR